MPIYNVTYDLSTPGGDYAGVEAAIKRSKAWLHMMQSTWLVATDETAAEVYNRIAPKLRKCDLIFVNAVTNRYYGWLPPKTWEWIKAWLAAMAEV